MHKMLFMICVYPIANGCFFLADFPYKYHRVRWHCDDHKVIFDEMRYANIDIFKKAFGRDKMFKKFYLMIKYS
ncbi:hypothetical protein T4D_8138 [Trichinella pseudospiralis]|uniref:Uncharacterized protein n=1 Tax=Trichinella pseudospiralis TaxID=6337 RepID=A0A0V1G2S3_TRIPS|nr:hypothetical protein T4D_8138 [Trichinella pseudospiralis]